MWCCAVDLSTRISSTEWTTLLYQTETSVEETLPWALGWGVGRGLVEPGLLVLKLQLATWVKVGRPRRRKREMYFCKLAPHKSDMQPSKEKAEGMGCIHMCRCVHTHSGKDRRKWTGKWSGMYWKETRGRGSSKGHGGWAPIHNQPIPCQFHAQQPSGKEVVCVNGRMRGYG